MNNMRKLSLCITTYNRCDLTLKCFEDVLDDSWVDEIILVDDCSEIEIYNKLADIVKDMPKVKLLSWFNEKGTFKINSSPASKDAFLNYILKDDYFKSGTKDLYPVLKGE